MTQQPSPPTPSEDTPNKGPTPGQPVEAAGVLRGADAAYEDHCFRQSLEEAIRLARNTGMKVKAIVEAVADRSVTDGVQSFAPAPQPQPDLAARVAELEAALRKIAENDVDGFHMFTPQGMQEIAQKALATKGGAK